ncbi:MAG: 50S ribosomal protein L24 [Dehalococcoidia bacterium]|nr:MAG: 50S ribosomal protein L24 [Dehalococcoidia bacterium]
MSMKIRKDDTVLVIAGKDKGKKGKVRQSLPKESRVVVEGVNVVKRHMRPRGTARQAGIIEREAPLQVSNVMLLCTKCNRPTRIGFRFLEDGTKVRICRRCGEVID